MNERNPKFEPRPGDILVGPSLRAKVITITIGEMGTVSVAYRLAERNEDFSNKLIKATISQWRRFVSGDRVREPWVKE